VAPRWSWSRGAQHRRCAVRLHRRPAHVLRVDDAYRCRVEGLEGSRYRDALQGGAVRDPDRTPLAITGEIDRVYLDVPGPVVLHDPARGRGARALHVGQTGFRDVVVWNPGPGGVARKPDMHEGDDARMVCIESAAVADPIVVPPGGTWSGAQRSVAVTGIADTANADGNCNSGTGITRITRIEPWTERRSCARNRHSRLGSADSRDSRDGIGDEAPFVRRGEFVDLLINNTRTTDVATKAGRPPGSIREIRVPRFAVAVAVRLIHWIPRICGSPPALAVRRLPGRPPADGERHEHDVADQQEHGGARGGRRARGRA
jgi:hypothetical protein